VAHAKQEIETFQPTEAVQDHMQAINQASKKNDDSLARILFHEDSEKAINNQINVEYTNCYLYHSLASYFSRDTVGLHGFAAYFRDQSDDERHHAQLFMDFLSKRGGRVMLGSLSAPPNVRPSFPVDPSFPVEDLAVGTCLAVWWSVVHLLCIYSQYTTSSHACRKGSASHSSKICLHHARGP
jgi:hypothetical protein